MPGGINNFTPPFPETKEFSLFVKYLKPGAVILDVGCGYGRDVPLFLGIGRKLKYEGLDISRKFIKIASALQFPRAPTFSLCPTSSLYSDRKARLKREKGQ